MIQRTPRSSLPEVDAAAQARIWDVDTEEIIARTHLAAALRETHEESGVVLAPTALVPWARWVTPEVGSGVRRSLLRCPLSDEPVAAAPDRRGSERAVARVRTAVERIRAGALPMWPPTISTLLQLVPFDHVAAALAAAPESIEAVTE